MNVITQMVDSSTPCKTDRGQHRGLPSGFVQTTPWPASVAGSLPCIIDLDQPTVPNFAWSGYVQGLPISEEMLAKVSTGGVGMYQDKVYSLGQFDVALVNYARKSVLEKHGIRIPALDEPWTLDEFNTILQT